MLKKILFVAVLAGIVSCLFSQETDSTSLTAVGDRVPEFTVNTLGGKTIDIKALRGKVVMIQFFAPGCSPCQQELPMVQERIWDTWKDREFMLVCIGREHSMIELKEFLKDKKYTFPMAPDPDRDIYKKFATMYIPRIYIVDREGKIAYQSKGYAEEEFQQLLEVVGRLLN